MGRTTPTTGDIMQKERSALNAFRRALPKAYQREFDEIWAYVSQYLMPCNCADYPLPFYIFMLSILLEQRKRMAGLGLE
jgi:hypothetical protein